MENEYSGQPTGSLLTVCAKTSPDISGMRKSGNSQEFRMKLLKKSIKDDI